MAGDWYEQVCDVCRLLDGDLQMKFCFYCGACDAWICEDCQHDWGRRGRASAIALAERFAS